MKRMITIALISALLIPFSLHGAAFDPLKEMPKAIDPLVFSERLAAISFTDQTGEAVSIGDFRGQIVLINFMYTTCGTVCPMQTQYMKSIHQEMPEEIRRDFVMLSVSLLPEEETPNVLSDYTRKMNIDSENWRFLTGLPSVVTKAAEMFGIKTQRSENNVLEHTATFFLLDGNGVIIQRYANQVAAIQRITSDVMALHELNIANSAGLSAKAASFSSATN
ncbi:SCO family protein [Enterovibrio sp. 27052020O]|uniref:SCO family protein n=1 Tax=Enterovibrio sp. 27052020O TaxID=3241166 RepID=UPI003890509D